MEINYYFFRNGSYMTTCAATYPAAYADELAELHEIPFSEITWEPADVGLDVFFPPETSEREAALQAENELLVAEIKRLRERGAQIENDSSGEFWYKMYRDRFSKKDVTK